MNISTSAVTPEKVLQRLDWQVVRKLDGLLQGNYRSLFYGFGVDFADLREYQAEDDIRYIDWNVTARMQTPYIRQYTEDREVSAWFILDMSPSVDFGSLRPDGEKRNGPEPLRYGLAEQKPDCGTYDHGDDVDDDAAHALPFQVSPLRTTTTSSVPR